MGNEPLRVENDDSFSKAIDRPWPVLALFGSRGDVRSEVMELGLATVARELGDSVEFIRCPLHRGVDVFRRYRVRRVPTLILFRRGVPVGAYDGLATIPVVRAWIASTLGARRPGTGSPVWS
jgi:thioredoxin-like negative regulator of GroEL